MCAPKGFIGIDFDGDGTVSELESYLTYKITCDSIEDRNKFSDTDDTDDLFDPDDE